MFLPSLIFVKSYGRYQLTRALFTLQVLGCVFTLLAIIGASVLRSLGVAILRQVIDQAQRAVQGAAEAGMRQPLLEEGARQEAVAI